MTSDAAFVFVLIGVAAVLMASNRVRYDLVALIVVLALVLGNVLTVGQALSGFGSSVVILVACLLVVGEMLQRTGVARSVGDLILKRGGSNETRLMILLMVSAGFLGSVMSSTAVVAIFIPIVLRIAAETGLDKSRLLLPMSYAALISGMLTLIATTPNLVVSDELVAQGYQALGFFSFFPLGVIILAATIALHALVGPSSARVARTGEIDKAQAAGPRSGRTLDGLQDRRGGLRLLDRRKGLPGWGPRTDGAGGQIRCPPPPGSQPRAGNGPVSRRHGTPARPIWFSSTGRKRCWTTSLPDRILPAGPRSVSGRRIGRTAWVLPMSWCIRRQR